MKFTKALLHIGGCLLLLVGVAVYLHTAQQSTVVSAAYTSEPMTQLDTQNKVVYLTFDTAMGQSYLPQILDVLKQQRVPAAFAVLGDWITQYPEQAALLKQSKQQVFSHSMHHPLYTDIPAAQMQQDAIQAKKQIEAYFSQSCSYIRPPYGAWTLQTTQLLAELEMQSILWRVDAQDWREGITSEQIVNNVVGAIKPGDIVLFQTNCQETPQALADIISVLKEMGYHFEKLPE